MTHLFHGRALVAIGLWSIYGYLPSSYLTAVLWLALGGAKASFYYEFEKKRM